MHGLDVKYIVEELKTTVGGKVTKIAQYSRNHFSFTFFVSGKGRVDLRIQIPQAIFLAPKMAAPLHIPACFQQLRNHLMNARLQSLTQPRIERIIEMKFSTVDKEFILIIELFNKGNLILCDKNYKILIPLSSQRWKDRSIKKGEKYLFPQIKADPFSFSLASFEKITKASIKESLVKSLAVDSSLGGKYAEEVCSLAEVDKKITPADITKQQFKSLYTHLQDLGKKKLDPQVMTKDDLVIDVLPFPLSIYPKSKKIKTFSAAFIKLQKIENQFKSKFEKKIMQKQKILASLTENIKDLETKADENASKGEKLYESYEVVKHVLTHINEKSKEISLQQLQKKLKSHKVVKKIIPKKHAVVVEL